MPKQIGNARIVQRADLAFDLLYEDEAGETITSGPHPEPHDAEVELDRLRDEIKREADDGE